jgi:tRNA A-37 threonylcarbamoyl transferase component Bud32
MTATDRPLAATETPPRRPPLRVLREAEAARPEVRVEDWDGTLVVVKDYTVKGTWVKRLVGRFLVGREAAAHRRLADVEGVPPALETGDPCVFAHLYVEGAPAPGVPDRLTPAFFERLYALVAELHARGLAHGDLKRLENVLVQRDGAPALVDLSAAILSGSNPLAAALLGYIVDDDFRGIAKLKQRHAPHLLTAAERDLLNRRGLAERAWRWARSYLRPWLQHMSHAGED